MWHAREIVVQSAVALRLERVLCRRFATRVVAISEAVADAGFYYAPDPSSQIACSIGGNVAENSGGVHCLKYGMTGHNVLACEMVLMSGEVIRIGSTTGEAPGYDLLGVVTGFLDEIVNPILVFFDRFLHALDLIEPDLAC